MRKIGVAVVAIGTFTVLALSFFLERKDGRDLNEAASGPDARSSGVASRAKSASPLLTTDHAMTKGGTAGAESASLPSTLAVVPVASAMSSEVVEIVLPPPPSGDYDLNLNAEQINAILEQRYGKLFPILSLTPEALVRLRALLAERQQVTIDAANAAVLFGLDPVRDLAATQEAIGQFQAAVDAKIRQEFGEAIFARYRDFDRTLRERNAVRDFGRELAALGDPLEPRQEAAVLQILEKHPGENPPLDINRAIFGDLTTLAPISDSALVAATRVLSPRQLDVLRKLQRR